MNLGDVAVGILHHTLVDVFGTLDDIAVLESHLFARSESEELLGSIFHEVVALNPQFAAELNLVGAVCLVLGVVDDLVGLGYSFGEVGDDEFHGVDDRTHTLSPFV